jgi:hypothetical protein
MKTFFPKYKKVWLVMALSIFVIVLIGCAWHVTAKKEYERLVKVIEGHELTRHPIDNEAASFLEIVRGSWKVHEQACPDPIFSDVLVTAGFEVSASGMASFCTHRLPEYSFFDSEQNAREGIRALTMGVALSKSLDGRVYVKKGLCFIKLSEKAVDVFEDHAQGLSRTLYLDSKKEDEVRGNE